MTNDFFKGHGLGNDYLGLVSTASVWMRFADAVGVKGVAVTHDLGMNGRISRAGVLQRFKNQDPSPFAKNEAIAIAVEGPGRL